MAAEHKGIFYWDSHEAAQEASTIWMHPKWRNLYRIVEYERGFAVQLHRSGPYLGRDLATSRHSCPWCSDHN